MASIWLIEDNIGFRKATQLALNLQPERYSWKAFGSCEAALKAIQPGKSPDVILLDVELPGMDGIQGIQHFKTLAPNVCILILTVFEDDDKIFRAICAGASGYLLKSETFQNIILAISQALDGGAPMNPQIAKRVLSMLTKLAPVKKDYGLTRREHKILELMVEGMAKKQIADQLGLNPYSINYSMRCVFRKLHVHCQTAAVSVAMRNGLVGMGR
jgi:DNA-binding NarL/FixJ family response regulator